jgi:thioredoxin-like negative regulator of GroEL
MANDSRRERLEAMLKEDPTDPFLRYGLAMEYVGAGNDDIAARHFADLLKASPDYVAAYFHAGQALVRLGRDDEARAILQKGIGAAQKKGDSHAASEMQGFLDTLA